MAYHIRKPHYNRGPYNQFVAPLKGIKKELGKAKRELSPSNNDGLVWLGKTAKRVNVHVNPFHKLFTVWGNAYKAGYNRGRYGRYGRPRRY